MQLSGLRRDPAGLAIFQRLVPPGCAASRSGAHHPSLQSCFSWHTEPNEGLFCTDQVCRPAVMAEQALPCPSAVTAARRVRGTAQGPGCGGDRRGTECVTLFCSSVWSTRVPAKVRGHLHQVLPRTGRNSLIHRKISVDPYFPSTAVVCKGNVQHPGKAHCAFAVRAQGDALTVPPHRAVTP